MHRCVHVSDPVCRNRVWWLSCTAHVCIGRVRRFAACARFCRRNLPYRSNIWHFAAYKNTLSFLPNSICCNVELNHTVCVGVAAMEYQFNTRAAVGILFLGGYTPPHRLACDCGTGAYPPCSSSTESKTWWGQPPRPTAAAAAAAVVNFG